MGTCMYLSLLIISLLVLSVNCAPKGRGRTPPPVTYDQKQTGDYNIQLHLKDFQIIALLNDDSLGGLGDYDYNYDYSDFTIKPKPGNSTTPKPSAENATVIIVPHHKPTFSPRPSSTNSPFTLITSSTTSKPPTQSVLGEENPVHAELANRPPSSTMKPIEESPLAQNRTEQQSLESSADESPSSPDKIKVQILQSPLVPFASDVSIEEVDVKNPVAQLGETVHYRKCLTGYARDKKGKCRRLRRPNFPFGIDRLASGLAARLAGSSPLSSSYSSLSSDSSED